MAKLIDDTIQSRKPFQNLSALDRAIRIAFGSALLSTGFISDASTMSLWGAIMLLIAIPPLLSGILGWCPIYEAFSAKTCGISDKNVCGTLPQQLDRLMHK